MLDPGDGRELRLQRAEQQVLDLLQRGAGQRDPHLGRRGHDLRVLLSRGESRADDPEYQQPQDHQQGERRPDEIARQPARDVEPVRDHGPHDHPQRVLSKPRSHCDLTYRFDPARPRSVWVERTPGRRLMTVAP
jgi:hypothetical protein